jgi:hypothetical protein
VRKPTMFWLLLLDRIFEISRGCGLDLFDNLKLLRDCGVLDFALTGSKCQSSVFVALLALPIPGSLWICADQEQKQITGVNVLSDDLRLTVEFIFDWAHRSSNDVTDTILKSGLWVVYMMALVIFNNPFGPFNTSAWWQDLRNTAKSFKGKLTKNDPLLLRFWDGIVSERKLAYSSCDNDVGEAARQRFLDTLDMSAVVSAKGQRCSKKQWWSFNRTFKENWQHCLSERAFLYSGTPYWFESYGNRVSVAAYCYKVCATHRLACYMFQQVVVVVVVVRAAFQAR